MGLKHGYKSLKADPADATIIGASKWNADHFYIDASGNPIGNVGALLFSGVAGAITQIDSVAAGQVLASGGAGVPPFWTASPTLTSIVFAGGVTIDGSEIGMLDGVTPGVVVASKVVVVDANKDIASFRNLTAAAIVVPIIVGPSNAIDIRNGIVPQRLHVYGSYTDAANYNRLSFYGSATGTTPGVYAEGIGTGGDPNLYLSAEGGISFYTASTSRWLIAATGHLLAGADNTYDIGANGATRPRSLYLGTSINIAGLIVASAAGIAINGAGATGITFDRAGVTYGTISTGSNHLTFTASNGATFDFAGGDVKLIGTSTLAIGTNPATTGAIRLANNNHITARNAANTADINLIGLMTTNAVLIGNGATDVNIGPGVLSLGGVPATQGAIRLPNNQAIYARNAANSGNVALLQSDAGNNVYVGNLATDLVLNAANIYWKPGLVALGGGAAPTLGTIGGTGPTVAAQNSWMQVRDSAGALFWVPAWK